MPSADHFRGDNFPVAAKVIGQCTEFLSVMFVGVFPHGECSMALDQLETLKRQMWALSHSRKSDPVLKALSHLVWQLLDEQQQEAGRRQFARHAAAYAARSAQRYCS